MAEKHLLENAVHVISLTLGPWAESSCKLFVP